MARVKVGIKSRKEMWIICFQVKKDEHYLVLMTEELGYENQNTWFVAKDDGNVSNV
ncbi:MAG: hypothetical protein AAGF26_09310 [Cyanobacteria bacterium P01_G01_bin.49]